MSKYDYLHAIYQELLPLNTQVRNSIMREIEDKFRDAEEKGEDMTSVTNLLGTPLEYAQQFLNIENSIDNSQSNDIAYLDTTSDNESDDTHKTSSFDETKKELPLHITPTHYNQIEHRKVYTSTTPLTKKQVANSPIKILFIAFAMLFFNAVFIIGPFIGIWASIIAFIASGFAIVIGGIAIVLSGLLSLPLGFITLPLVILEHPILLFSTGFLLIGIGGLLTIAMIYVTRFFGYLTFKYANWNISVIRGY